MRRIGRKNWPLTILIPADAYASRAQCTSCLGLHFGYQLTLLQAEKALEAITNKIEGGAKKDSQEMDRAIATMINGKRERQTLAKAHLAECATLSQDLGTLVQTMVEMRKSSLPVLARTIEERIDTVREAVLTEVAALKSRPGVSVMKQSCRAAP